MSTTVAAHTGWAALAPPQQHCVLFNGRIWTGNISHPWASALWIKDGKIAQIGSLESVRQSAGRQVRLVDLKGRFTCPGFNDSHLHMTRMASEYFDVDLMAARTIADVQNRIRERVAITPIGEWIQTRSQWHESLLAERRMPTRQDLDAVAPDHPVYMPRGGHVATANSRALALAGITRDTPDPPFGVIVRDSNGEPTGLLLERARTLVAQIAPRLSSARYLDALSRQATEFSKAGLTSLTNPSTTPNELEGLRILRNRGALPIRVNWTAGLDSADAIREHRTRYAPFAGDDFLRFTGIGETGTDGGVEGAFLREPYRLVPGEQEDPGYVGLVTTAAQDEAHFAEMYLAAIESGYPFMTHVTGDGGLDVALRILGEVRKKASYAHLRWVLHGVFLADQHDLAAIRALDLGITAQAQAYLLGVQIERWWGHERANRTIPIKAFVDNGIRVGGGSDAPAGVANPLESLGWMVNRSCLGGLQLDRRWSVTAEQALRLYTLGSAETQFMERQVGVLALGMLADLVILDRDITRIAPDEINSVANTATLLGGRIMYDRDGLFD